MFCEGVQPILSNRESDENNGLMDDFKVSGQVDAVASDVDMIVRSAKDTGLALNPSKCEILCSNGKVGDKPIFKDYIRVRPEDDLNLLYIRRP